MSTRLLLEGPDLPALLERVRAEHGPDARIVAAEKVRSGGIGGFFARERFEVQVEVDEIARGGGPDSLEALVDLVDAVEAAAPPFDRAAALSTQTPDFAALLAALQEASAPEPPGQGPVRGFAPGLVAGSAPTIPGAGRDTSTAPTTTATATTATTTANGTATGTGERGLRWAQVGLPPALCAQLTGPTHLDHPDDPGRPGDAAANRAGQLAALVAVLRTLPVPPRLPRAAGSVITVVGPAVPALEVAQRLARRLRVDPETILLAAPGAQGTGLPAARRIASPTEAHRRVGRLHRAVQPTLVVVDAPLDDEAAGWAVQVTDALAPHATWAAVDARVKPADIRAHLARLGHLDAVAVYGARQTADPGTVLGLGYPIGLLDGGPATPRSLACLLADRLEVATSPVLLGEQAHW